MSYRDRLFAQYYETHARHVEVEGPERARWFHAHVARNYLSHLPPAGSGPELLELGCGKGLLLAALRERGYARLTGVDLSADDLELAQAAVPGARLELADAYEFLLGHPESFDVIVAKAILEHQEKSRVLPLLAEARGALRPGGLLLVEVPNMDWLLASHERFMDFTHEVGFTRESLAQVLRAVFGHAQVRPVEPVVLGPWPVRAARHTLRPVVRLLVGGVLRVLGEGGESTWWHCRGILGVARRTEVAR